MTAAGQVTTIDPASGARLADYDETTDEQVDATLDRAHRAFLAWRDVPVAERAAAVGTLGPALRDRADELARLATREMGKPLAQSQAEVEKCAAACEWFAEQGPAMLRADPREIGALSSHVEYGPLGVLFAIMPWNFPYWQVIRALAPAAIAGNVVVLKHAPSTTGAAIALAEVTAASALPPDLLSVIVAGFDRTPKVSERIINDDRVAAVTLTGSTGAGRAVAALAGQALKKTVLELGGSDPFIVLADADLDAAADYAVRARFQNTGQSCIAAKRVIVEEPAYDEFTARFLAGVARLVTGDPMGPGVTVGPLARADLRDAVARQVDESVRAGARLLAGGQADPRPGFYYQPTVLDQVTADMPVLAEEVFGPAVPLVRAADAEEAVRLANQTRLGLGSNLWTADIARARLLASRIDAGHTAINGMTASDPRLPFGGVKESGYGRELSRHGILEFVNVHTVVAYGPHGPEGSRAADVE
ncbi:MAG TPA: NAD-dependent succinate-semialdehyde dehydrogenase [Trebonia sp.]|jgi:succinate-semialdehyde dehydrogenase/glutarate-semialdehyde dehydrogenase|nr:NAD-dependent succinate-semialdehyde dehydrogenase [Trebonia sp.]